MPEGIREPALVAALLSGDRAAAYRLDRDRALIYLQRMTVVFRDYCPAALPPDLPQVIAGEFMDPAMLTGSRDAMAAAGWQAIVQGAQVLADPGPAMAQAMRTDQIHLAADGDAQILLNGYQCTGPELRGFFANARAYVVNPSEGVAPTDLRMADVCLAALNRDVVTRELRLYCDCAGAVLDTDLDEDAKTWLRADPPAHYLQLPVLARRADARLQSCRR